MKTCSLCGTAKPAEEFYPGRSQDKGCYGRLNVERQRLRPDLNRARQRRYRERHPDREAARRLAWQRANRDRIARQRARYRDKRASLEPAAQVAP